MIPSRLRILVAVSCGLLAPRFAPGQGINPEWKQAGKSKREREIRDHLDRWRGSAAAGWTTDKVMDLTRGDD